MKETIVMPRPVHRGAVRRCGALLGAVLLASACDRAAPPTTAPAAAVPAAKVVTAQVALQQVPVTAEVMGTVEPRLSARVEAKITGRIAALPVTLGQRVHRGDNLVRLDAAEIDARLAQAEAARRQAEIDYARVQKLLAGGAATRAEFDAADSRLREARAAVAEARAMTTYTQIDAPFDGVISAKLADRGDFAMPGKALLTLDGEQGLRFVADLPAALAGRVSEGTELSVMAEGLASPVTGRVSEIAPNADPASRTLHVKLDLPATVGLMSGQFGRVAVPLDAREVLLVPASALVVRGQLEMVFVVADGRANMRLVRAGRAHDGQVEILSGLEPGAVIVTEHAATLGDGQALVSP
jgi:RND family efflux transporter MFP subunit